jgi:hypothetical protein
MIAKAFFEKIISNYYVILVCYHLQIASSEIFREALTTFGLVFDCMD